MNETWLISTLQAEFLFRKFNQLAKWKKSYPILQIFLWVVYTCLARLAHNSESNRAKSDFYPGPIIFLSDLARLLSELWAPGATHVYTTVLLSKIFLFWDSKFNKICWFVHLRKHITWFLLIYLTNFSILTFYRLFHF